MGMDSPARDMSFNAAVKASGAAIKAATNTSNWFVNLKSVNNTSPLPPLPIPKPKPFMLKRKLFLNTDRISTDIRSLIIPTRAGENTISIVCVLDPDVRVYSASRVDVSITEAGPGFGWTYRADNALVTECQTMSKPDDACTKLKFELNVQVNEPTKSVTNFSTALQEAKGILETECRCGQCEHCLIREREHEFPI